MNPDGVVGAKVPHFFLVSKLPLLNRPLLMLVCEQLFCEQLKR